MPQIDFVLAWVDGSDKEWRKEHDKYARLEAGQKAVNISEDTDNRDERYRDWDILRYWFRGVEKYASWVQKIHFVTWGHLPKWLNTEHPKLNIVRHEDYIPSEFLPTFNSHPIEIHFHRIKGLAEQFVYFNDDMLLTGYVKPEDFFVDGKPKDMLALQPVVANAQNTIMPYIYLNNSMVLAKHFDKRRTMKQRPGGYFHFGYPPMYFFYNMIECMFPRFTGFYTVHGPSPLLKQTYKEIWKQEEDCLRKTSSHKFRSKQDISQYLFREWQKLSGNFVPANVKKYCSYFELDEDNHELFKALKKHSAKMVCINDANVEIDFERAKKNLVENFEQILPEKSSFEKESGGRP